MIEIEKGVPLPTQATNNVYFFEDLDVGDSVVRTLDLKIRAALSAYKRRHPGWNYVTRTQPDGSVRIWRTA